MEELTGKIRVSKSLIGDARQALEVNITARDNEGEAPSNQAANMATIEIHIIGDKQTGIVLVEATGSYVHNHESLLERLLFNCFACIYLFRP